MLRVVLLLCLAAALCASLSTRRPFRSVKAPAETVEAYSIVEPEIVYSEPGDELYPKVIHVVVAADDFNYTLILELNDMLISPKFTSHYYDDHGKMVATKGHANCYYHGKVKEHPDWSAVINICHGLRGSFGVHGGSQMQENLFHIEPLDPLNDELSQPHAVYLDSEYEIGEGTCGSSHLHPHDRVEVDINGTVSSFLNRGLAKKRVNRQTGQQFMFVELVMVNDRSQYVFFSENLDDTIARTLDIANHMDNLFRVLNVRIALVDVITWTNRDQINIVNDAEMLLTNFRGYVGEVDTSHDALMLNTHIDLAGSTIGIAFTSTMCSPTASVGLSQDQGGSVNRVGSTASHELGHIMNMDHDDAANCNCPSGQSRCIMAATLSRTPPTQWSQCSRDNLQDGFNNRNLDRCLFNQPASVVGEPVCGNGIQEANEDCDCGSSQECTNPCCNASTCRLVANAQCASGSCCDLSTCQYHVYGTTCRVTRGDCDIAEFCMGDAADCPLDTYLKDGTSCNNNQDNCFEGTCQSYDSQCQFHFATNKGRDACYRTNTNGDVFGNCGYTQTSFIACLSSDVFCGMLFCQTGTYQNTVSIGVSVVTVGGGTCNGFTPQPGADIENPGLVNDGSRCGNGRVCYDQRCILVGNLPSLANLSPCPTRNGQQCSNNGMCNQLGGCTCNVGFTGDDCSTATAGPGVGPVNECMENNGGCDQICMDTMDSFTCQCNTGFTLQSDSRSCLDIDECSQNTDGCAQMCTNNLGSFECSCTAGYTIAPDARGCNDLNECATNNGGCESTCTNTDGSFMCSCGSGFLLADNRLDCVDINECNDKDGGCNQVCTNMNGGHECSCRDNFEFASDGQTCVAIRPCGVNNCDQLCYLDNSGSPICDCNNGHQLGADRQTCTEINECAGDHGCSDICVNIDGSFQCQCELGFELDATFRNCRDIDECVVDNVCSDYCVNSEGSFSCECFTGSELDDSRTNCIEINSTRDRSNDNAGSSSNAKAIGIGVTVAVVAVGLAILVIVIIIYIARKKSSSPSTFKNTKYSQPRGNTTESHSNLFNSQQSLYSVQPSPEVAVRGIHNHHNSGYKAPTYQPTTPPPSYPSLAANGNQSRRAPPQPPASAAPRRPAPERPKATAPPKPARPIPPQSATPTQRPMAPPKPSVYVPPATSKPPPPANKPAPWTKPSPAPKPSAPPRQWPPPSSQHTSSRPVLPPSKKPMVPPKK